MKHEWQAEEWCHAQVSAKAARRWVVVKVPAIVVAEFQELSGTPGVDQEVELGWDKSKGQELVPESTMGGEL